MNDWPLVSVLILTFNRTDLLKDCLESVFKSDYPNLEFIISDNGSDENIASFIEGNYPNQGIKVVRLDENKGLTGGFNFGYKFCKGEYIMLLSNDTKLQGDAITIMVDMAKKDSLIGIVSPKIIQMKDPRYLHHAGSFITISGLLYHYGILQNKDASRYQNSYYIFSCNGAGFLIRKSVANECGLFDEDFFFFYDESDLSHRVWLAGYTVVYCPMANLWHLWSGTMKGANPKIWYYNHRNHISSFLRNLSFPYLLMMLFNYNLVLIFWFFLNLFKLRFDICVTLPQVYIWHLFHLNETIKKRNIIQTKLRKVSDNEIFKKCLVFPNWKYFFLYLNLRYKDEKVPRRVLYLK